MTVDSQLPADHVARMGSASDRDADPSVLHLLARLEVVETRVHAEVERRRGADPGDTDDRFRGLYISDLRVDALLADGPCEPAESDPRIVAQRDEVEAEADSAQDAGARLRLRALAEDFGLSLLDVELFLVALAPDLDVRFEPLYGYLNDDVSQRRATVGLALQLCGVSSASGYGRARLAPHAPLLRGGLIELSAMDRPALTRVLQVPDRVLAHLLGDDTPDPLVAPLISDAPPVPSSSADRFARAYAADAGMVYLRAQRGAGAPSAAAAGFAQLGLRTLAIDLTLVDADTDLAMLARIASREARLGGARLVAGPLDAVSENGPLAIRALTGAPGGVVLHGSVSWDPSWAADVPATIEIERVDADAQQAVWANELDEETLAAGVDPSETATLFRLTPDQVQRAVRSAERQAALDGRRVELDDLLRGARSQNAVGLQRLARRIEPRARWRDLVLPPDIEAQLRELAARWRHRDQVLDAWGLGRAAARGRGVSALFSGGSGTGKTLASEVLAGELGLDLYVIDLSTVVDKYIGETSKNLERIFDEADRVNGVLLFDEADALFGKRSSVSDSKDRHANVEVAFLLQRMEAFDGMAILTTNLAANLDEAFIRRLDAIVDFPSPDEPQRKRLWEAKLQPELPRADDVDLEVLANRFKLSGSEIRNVVVSAAYRAADEQRLLTMEDLVAAILREHRKLGRHLSRADLGTFASLADPSR